MSNEEVMRRYASLSPEFEGKIELEEVRLADYRDHERDELKAAIRAAKADLRIVRSKARELRRHGYRVPEELLLVLVRAREAVQVAKESYREWKRPR